MKYCGMDIRIVGSIKLVKVKIMWYNKNNNPGKARNIRASGVVCY